MSITDQTNLVDLRPSSYVDGIYGVYNPQVGTTRHGKPFLKCLLRDATGEIPARQWTFDENNLESLRSTGFVWVAGHTQEYNGQVQIIIEQIRPMEVGQEELSHLLPSTDRDIEDMFQEVHRLMNTLEHPAMRALADVYFNDDELMAGFKQAPAAISLHHAWIGGLLEHTLQVLQLADRMLPLYSQLNRDLVLMGLFLHDLAKTAELNWDKGFEYTTDGNLVGHVVRGAIWLQFKAAYAAKQSGHKLPSDALRSLQHIIISSHGRPEFGAARMPSTPEAVFVAHLDNLDAKTAMSLSAARSDRAGDVNAEFTDKVWALETRLYRPDPLNAMEDE